MLIGSYVASPLKGDLSTATDSLTVLPDQLDPNIRGNWSLASCKAAGRLILPSLAPSVHVLPYECRPNNRLGHLLALDMGSNY